jgi:hypothetical protein
MRRIHRLLVLVAIATIAGAFALYFTNYFISIDTDLTAKGTIAASAITVLGVIFSALYKEISSYYKERNQNISKKWKLILPFIKEHYNPWIGSAQSLVSSLKTLNSKKLSDDGVIRVLFLTTIFFGRRLRFILNEGGLILLSSIDEEKKVMEAYRQIERAFCWAADETPTRVSYLQKIFITKDTPNEPLVLWTFSEEVQRDAALQESRDRLKQWLTEQNINNLETKLNEFINTFKLSINKLYTAWSD